MQFIEIIFLAIGLAMDAFAVSISVGTTDYLLSTRARFRISFHFGLFQGLMPIIGWFAGSTIGDYIKSFDHWIAFILLAWVGGKMIKESFTDQQKEYNFNPSKGWNLIVLSVATSIDALAVGLSLSFIGVHIWHPAALIGIITGALSLVGILLGARIGGRCGKRAGLVGGLILCIIGIQIVIEHLYL